MATCSGRHMVVTDVDPEESLHVEMLAAGYGETCFQSVSATSVIDEIAKERAV